MTHELNRNLEMYRSQVINYSNKPDCIHFYDDFDYSISTLQCPGNA